MRIWVQKSASMQKRTSPLKFGDLAEKSGFNSVSNLSTKVCAGEFTPSDKGSDRSQSAPPETGVEREDAAELDRDQDEIVTEPAVGLSPPDYEEVDWEENIGSSIL